MSSTTRPKYSGVIYSVYHFFAVLASKIHFRKGRLSQEERRILAEYFAKGYYIILTGNPGHLSSLLVSVMTWFKLGRWSKYSHALMNCDFMDSVEDKDKFKFVEATAIGVHYSSFDEALDCDYVCLLTPKNVDNEEWTRVIDNLVKSNGRPYDDLFDLADSSHMSCVEVVVDAFKGIEVFEDLDIMIMLEKNLLPQMFKECNDFEVAYETYDKKNTRRTNGIS